MSKKKNYIYKKYDTINKTWDYEIPGWKPKKIKIKDKEDLLDESYTNWFDYTELYDSKKISELKSFYSVEKEQYNKNKFKFNMYFKQYAFYSALEIIFYDFSFKFNKPIYFLKEKYTTVYEEHPSLERLKTKDILEIPDMIKEISNIQFGIVNYWVFNDAVIFKN